MSERYPKSTSKREVPLASTELVGPVENIHLCPSGCGCHMAERFEEVVSVGHQRRVTLWCPNCEHKWSRQWNVNTLRRFDDNQGAAREKLHQDCDEFYKKCMGELIKSFGKALEYDLIGPDDFTQSNQYIG